MDETVKQGNLKEKAPKEIKNLIERFERNLHAIKSQGYNEQSLREEFVNPFFEALGWDVSNKSGVPPAERDVLHEDSIKMTGGGIKAPDYCFTMSGTHMFFVETKKPSIDIKKDARPAYQLRSYAWSAGFPLSILTNFEEFAIYESRRKPKENDKANMERMLLFVYTDYIEKWDEISSIFSKKAVQHGSFDKFIVSTKQKHGTQDVGDEFLKEIEGWREKLARNIAIRNPTLSSVPELNYSVQSTIDRIIFLRMCEDRGIEKYGQLRDLLMNNNIYENLCKIYLQSDEKYNSGLFHFKKEKGRITPPDDITLKLSIDDNVLSDIIKHIYPPESPYQFSVFKPEILGNVYEQFLGKVIHLTEGHRAKVEEKPEVKKAGGVYYTPEYIVNYIVKNTVGNLCEGRTSKQIEKLHILDPACGSGSFLLGAYTYLLKYHLDYYTKRKNSRKLKDQIYQGKDGQWFLTTNEKKRILLNNIYGVDIDSQAVEVTKLSLLLKVLEGENKDIFQKQKKLWMERVLPDLINNIKCGNSLIEQDFYNRNQTKLFENKDEIYRINAFDWNAEFKEIMSNGGFDAVIGNPPYLGRSTIFSDEEKQYIDTKYLCSEGKYETYQLFMERASKLLKNDGFFSFLTPQTWLSIKQASKLRKILLANLDLNKIVSIRKNIFMASVDNVISVFHKSNKNNSIMIYEVKDLLDFNKGKLEKVNSIDKKIILSSDDNIIDIYFNKSNRHTIDKFYDNSINLDSICFVKDGVKVVGPAKSFAFNKTKLDDSFFPMILGKDIEKYYLKWDGWYCCRDKNKIEKHNATDIRLREEFIFSRPKIVIRKTGHEIVATIDNQNYYYEQSLFSISKKDLNSVPDLKMILGILNSNITKYLLQSNPFSKKDTFPQIRLHWLKNIPIPIINSRIESNKLLHDNIVNLIDRMFDYHKHFANARTDSEKIIIQRQIDSVDQQINQLVYELYGLTKKEIAIVEENFKK